MIKKLLLLVICFLTFSFANAQLNSVAIVGGGTPNDWPTGAPNEVDAHQMSTTDGVNWTILNITLKNGPVKFRGNNSWTPYDWGGQTPFPNGTALLGSPDAITAVAGVYNVYFNSDTRVYTFAPVSVAIIGDGVGGWPSGAPNEVDPHQMTTTDGINWTISNLAISADAIKFRGNNSYIPFDWGATDFPNGTATAGSPAGIIPEPGIYTVNFNIKTLAYTFIKTSLGINDFDTIAFKAYPNPTQNNWLFSSSKEKIESIIIVDITGKIVKTFAPKSNEAAIDASNLTAGLYVAKVTTASAIQALKLIKQ